MNPTDLHRYPIDFAGEEPNHVETPSIEDADYEDFAPISFSRVIFTLFLMALSFIAGRYL